MDIGDKIKLTGTLTDVSGTPITDATVVFRVITPDNTEIAAALATLEGSGVYTGIVSITQSGTWKYRFEATGTAEAAEESAFTVKKSDFS